METLRFDIAAVLASSALFSVGIGLALQKVIQSVLAGFVLVGEREVAPGDVLEFNGVVVKVEKIRVRMKVLETRVGGRHHGAQSSPGPKRGAPPHVWWQGRTLQPRGSQCPTPRTSTKAQERLRGALASTSNVTGDQGVVSVDAFADSSVEFLVVVATDAPFGVPVTKSQLHFEAWRALRRGGIEIPFPQLAHDHHLSPARFSDLSASLA